MHRLPEVPALRLWEKDMGTSKRKVELGENECCVGEIKDLGQPPKKSPLKATVKKPWEDVISRCQERSLEHDSKTSNEKRDWARNKKACPCRKRWKGSPPAVSSKQKTDMTICVE